MNRRRPEVLAPAGDRESLLAAIQAGADAVYFGLSLFNARARAENFSEETLPETMALLHSHGVRGYVTLNTLVFDSELTRLERAIRACFEAGVDAVIVQDLGVMRLVRALAPGMAIHASTQMTCTDADSCLLAKELGASRVILARELSLADIEKIAKVAELELEVFVHGALCIAYSGQCLTSEAFGGRSANRGACAQACRLPYDLYVDGVKKDLGERAYLLSPQDLEAASVVPELAALGVRSLKIEGRLKGPEYVAATVALYRSALTRLSPEAGAQSSDDELDAARTRALQTFSRGASVGFFEGVNHQTLVEAKGCDHRGIEVGRSRGTVSKAGKRFVELDATVSLSRGDGVLFEGGFAGSGELGGRIWQFEPDVTHTEPNTRIRVWLGPDREVPETLGEVRVFRTNSPSIEKEIRAGLQQKTGQHKKRLSAVVDGRLGEPLTVTLTNERGFTVSAKSSELLTPARSAGLSTAQLREKLFAFGESPYELGALSVTLEDGLFIAPGHLKTLRRALVADLEHELASPRGAVPDDAGTAFLTQLRALRTDRVLAPSSARPELHVLCRTLAHARAAVAAGANGITLDFLELTGTGDALRALRAENAAQGKSVHMTVTPPRIRKPGEEKIDRYLLGLNPDGYLVRSLGALQYVRNLRKEAPEASPTMKLRGDFSLNVSNQVTARTLLELGLDSFTPSFDLDAAQLVAMLSDRELAECAEVVVHHPMPLFHMEHCVFAALLSDGKDHLTCGRPCDRHQIALRDRAGMNHPVIADVGCRNTVFHEKPQSAAELPGSLRKLGVRQFRIELVQESDAQVHDIVRCYRALLDDTMTSSELWTTLNTSGGYGVVRGSLRVIT